MIKKFHYYLLLASFLFVQGITAQNKTVSGTVKDDVGTPLPGVNVVEKGTTNGTSTDIDFQFRNIGFFFPGFYNNRKVSIRCVNH